MADIILAEPDRKNELTENNQPIEMQPKRLKNVRQVPETIMIKVNTRRAKVNPKVIPAQKEKHVNINQKALNPVAPRAVAVQK